MPDPSYVPPRLNTAKRFAEMQAAAQGAQAQPAVPAVPPVDPMEQRIKASAKSMDSLSLEALIRRAKAALGMGGAQ